MFVVLIVSCRAHDVLHKYIEQNHNEDYEPSMGISLNKKYSC